jgi:hypothetical protein
VKIRIFAAAGAAAISVAAVLAVPSAAQAADTFSCPGTGRLFAQLITGSAPLNQWPVTNIGTTSIALGTKTAPGSGWAGYGKVLGGHGGRIYGISSTTGLSMWKTVNGQFQGDRVSMSDGFKSYASATWKNKITVDERGDFYLIDNMGRLLWYRYDETRPVADRWVINGRIIDSGWDQFNLIVAAGPGVIWARRASDGALLRFRFDATSERWATYDQTPESPSNWGSFSSLSSPGGDVLYGVNSDGKVLTYRYREDTGTFPVSRAQLGTATDWGTYNSVLALPDACKLTDRHEAVRPALPIQPFSPTAAIQGPANGAAIGPLEYLYTDNIGTLRHGFQANPEDFGSVQWSALGTDELAWTGKPALAIGEVTVSATENRDAVHALTHETDGDVRSWVRGATAGWNAGENLSGALRSHPVAVRLTDDQLAVFAIDAAGKLWTRQQTPVRIGAFLGWRDLGGALTGELTVIPVAGAGAVLFGLDADGTPVTATYRAGVLSAWSELGGSGFTGTVSVVSMPGQVLRAFARDADGRIVTQQQQGGVFPGTWSPVGDFTAAGSPAAVLDPGLGRVAVVARGPDNELHRVFETAQGSNTWGDWLRLNPESSDPAASDPTVVPFVNGTGPSWLIVFRNQDNAHRVYVRQLPTGAAGKQKAATVTPAFAAHTLPAAPR